MKKDEVKVYNSILKVDRDSHYDMVSYGLTLSINLDIYVGKKGDKISAGLYVPKRSHKFIDNLNNDKEVNMEYEFTSIAISVGYNWRLN
ncbi:hypothetical protein [Flavobacterium sp. JP2137]|uniref:hypothetical protein n=1 Tax=Flavobacterium sp. JP2137 TaxID=3414510 RepID=UPI003D2FA62F